MTHSRETLCQIESEYGDLHDALIIGFDHKYNLDNYSSNIHIKLSAYNLDDAHRDIIELEFLNVKSYQFSDFVGMIFSIKVDTTSSSTFKMDFEPIIASSDGHGNLKLDFNPDSACIIESTEIKFRRIGRIKKTMHNNS